MFLEIKSIATKLNEQREQHGTQANRKYSLLYLSIKKTVILTRIVEYRKSVIQWLAPYDPTQLYRQALAVYEAGTGKWFLDGPYEKWSSEEVSMILWLKGKRKSPVNVTLCAHAKCTSWQWENHDYVGQKSQTSCSAYQKLQRRCRKESSGP